MARSDLVVKLAKAGLEGSKQNVKRVVEAIVTEEVARQHHIYADKLKQLLREDRSKIDKKNLSNSSVFQIKAISEVQNLYVESKPQRNIDSISLDTKLRDIFNEFLEEHRNAELLRSHAIEPRNKIILTGAPGNGKTSLAEALAFELGVPFFSIRYEEVIGSYLGETASRLKAVFSYFSTRPCVIFFDEFDAIGKERGDVHETGEIKRVVSSLLLQIDAIPSYNIFIGATNHSELIDRAAWRRFQIHAELPPPILPQIIDYLISYEREVGVDFGSQRTAISEKLFGKSFSAIEQLLLDVRRKVILSRGRLDLKSVLMDSVGLVGSSSISKDCSGKNGKATAHSSKSSKVRRSPEGQSEIFQD